MTSEKYYSGNSLVVMQFGRTGSYWNFGLSTKLLLKQTLKLFLISTCPVSLFYCVQKKRVDGCSLHYPFLPNKNETCISQSLAPSIASLPICNRDGKNHSTMNRW